MSKCKIAMMIPGLSGGGAEKVAADLSVYFEQKGYEVFIFVDSRQEAIEYQHGGKIVCVRRAAGNISENNKVEILHNLLKDADVYRKLKRRYRIDITLSFMQEHNLLNILSRCDDKVIVTIHSVMSQRKELGYFLGYGKKIFKYLYQLADRIVFVSHFCREDWINHYGDLLSKTIVIYNPVNTISPQKSTDKEIDNSKWGSNIVISVARLSGVKQHWHLIRAFKRVLDKCPDAQLLIAGEGILKDALKNLSVQLGIDDHIHFLGFVRNVEEYLRKAKCIVVTSASESWSCSTGEAMEQGVPVVANDCPGGIRELLGIGSQPRYKNRNLITDCGIITPRLDGKKYIANEQLTAEENFLADGILCLLKDDSLKGAMAENCIKRIQKFKLGNIGRIWERDVIQINSKFGRCIGILTRITCTALKFALDIIFMGIRYNKNELKQKQNIYKDKFVAYYYVLEKWMCLKEEGRGIEKYFLDHGYQKIAIYGMAKMANHLINELESSPVEIVCGIDKRADGIYGKFPVVNLNDKIPHIDVIVVTPIFDYTKIRKMLNEKTKCQIVSLEDIINYNILKENN